MQFCKRKQEDRLAYASAVALTPFGRVGAGAILEEAEEAPPLLWRAYDPLLADGQADRRARAPIAFAEPFQRRRHLGRGLIST